MVQCSAFIGVSGSENAAANAYLEFYHQHRAQFRHLFSSLFIFLLRSACTKNPDRLQLSVLEHLE